MKHHPPTEEHDMNAVRIETTIDTDGELPLTQLPCRKWDRVEVISLIPGRPTEEEQEAARQRFPANANQPGCKSTSPYPPRDELHGRS
jgi:hypothetical protein